jgi:hypothetical protein
MPLQPTKRRQTEIVVIPVHHNGRRIGSLRVDANEVMQAQAGTDADVMAGLQAVAALHENAKCEKWLAALDGIVAAGLRLPRQGSRRSRYGWVSLKMASQIVGAYNAALTHFQAGGRGEEPTAGVLGLSVAEVRRISRRHVHNAQRASEAVALCEIGRRHGLSVEDVRGIASQYARHRRSKVES